MQRSNGDQEDNEMNKADCIDNRTLTGHGEVCGKMEGT